MAILNHGSSIRTADGGQSTTTIVTASNIGTYGIAANSTYYIGTTQNVFNRASSAQTLTGVSIDGNAANITAYTINQNVGTGNAPSFTGMTSTAMLVASTSMNSVDDWQNSPISIRERGLVAAAQSANTYSPNLNFHWASRISNSLWMDANGNLSWGSYDGTGVPSSDGAFYANNLYASIYFDKNNTVYYLDAANSGTSLLVAGNVGIGNTSPSAKLHVLGASYTTASAANNNVRFEGGGGNGLGFGTIDATSTYASWIQSGYVPNFATATYALLLNPLGGNVGIGTTSPTQLLDVRGNIKLGGDNSGNYIYYVTDIERTIVRTTRSDVTQEGLLRSDGWGNFTFSNNIGVGLSLGTGYGVGSVGSGIVYANGSVRAPIFYDSANTAYYLDAANSGTSLLVAGKVGIGTTSPAYKLDVGASGSDAISVRLTPGFERVRYYGFDLLGYNDGNLWMIGNNATNTLVLGGSWDWDRQIAIAYTPATTGAAGGSLEIGQMTKNNANFTHGNTRFYTNGIERVRINSSGNVGMGTTSPSAKLHIYNSTAVDTLLESGTSGTTGKLIFKTSDNADLNKYIMQESYYMILNGHTNEGFKFRDSASNVLLSIFGAANTYASRVGIGTQTPAYKLDVSGAINASTYMYAGVFYDNDNTAFYANPSGASIFNGLKLVSSGNQVSGDDYSLWIQGGNDDWGIGIDKSSANYGITYNLATSHTYAIQGRKNGTEYFRLGTDMLSHDTRLQAPIFYDSNNTAYYIDGASGSKLKYLQIDGDWASSPFGSGHESFTIRSTYASMVQRQTNEALAYWLHHIAGNGAYHLYGGRGATDGSSWDWAYRAYPNQDGNYVEFNTSARAQIFYDRNDTNYYLDPASTSRLNTLNVVGAVSGARGVFSDSSGSGSAVIEAYNTVATNGTTAIFRQTTAGGNGNQDIGLLVDIQGAADTDRIANFRYYNGSTYTSRMAIMRGGNVGIGTTSPAAKLQINNASDSRLIIYETGAAPYTATLELSSQVLGTYGGTVQYTSNAETLTIQNYGRTAANSSTGSILFKTKINNTTATDVVIINGFSGNVGIGTTSPSVKLAVDGEASFGDGSKLTMIGLDINSGVTPNFIKIRTKIPFASGAADFTINIKGFRYGSVETTSLMVCWHYYLSTFYNPTISSAGSFAPTVKLSAEDWDSSGTPKVCIVLVSPGYWPKLYVESMYSSAYNDAYADGWDWVDADATGTGNNLAILTYKSNFGNSFVMLSDGNVGIGTISPSQKLHVVGTGFASTDFRSPIFYDSNNTAYYLDPASTSNLVGLTVANTITGSITGNAATATRTSSQSGYPHAGTGMFAFYNWGGTDGGTSAPSASTYTTGISVGSNPGDQAYGFQIANNMWNTGLWTRNYNSSFGAWIRLLDSSNYVGYSAFTSSLTSTVDARAPIFYDSNDTNYYVDPSSNSILLDVEARGGINLRRDLSVATGISFYSTSYHNWQVYMAPAGATGCGANGNLTASNGLTNVSSWALRSRMENVGTYGWLWELGAGGGGGPTATSLMELDTGGILTLSGQVRAPIFYDSNNTAFYCDPTATSNFTGLTVANTITGSISGNAGTATILQTARNINGTSFNGSAAITTATWGTARTLTIGSTGKSVDGSAAVSWSLAEIGALPLSGGQITGNTTFSADNHLTFGPNSTWGSSIRIGGNGYTATGTETASVVTTDGNLHLDAAKSTNGIYLNWYGGTSGVFFGNGSSGQVAFVSNTGNASFSGVVDATQFRDASNTAYYVDPASTSILNRIDLPSGSATINTTTPGQTVYQLNFTGQGTADNAQAITWGWSTSGAQAGIYVQSSGAYGTKMYIATTDSFATGSKTALTIDHTGVVTTNRNYLQATGSLRAPIFYDSDNTAYYIDAASTSNLNVLNAVSSTTLWVRSGSWAGDLTSNGFTREIGMQMTGGSEFVILSKSGQGYTLVDGSYYAYEAGGFYSSFNSSYGAIVGFSADSTTSVTFNCNVKAPIYYDSNNTSYYLDPNSTTSLRTVGSWRSDSSTWDGEFSGKIQYHANHWYFQAADSWLFRSSGGNNVVSISQTGSVTAAQYYTGGWFRNNSSGNGLYNESTGQHFYSDSANYWNVASSAGAQGIRLRTGGYNGTVRGYFYADTNNDVGFLNQDGSWRLRVVGGDYALADGSSMRAQIFYDSNNTAFYIDGASTSNLNVLNIADGNLELYKSQTVDMSNTTTYSTSNYYPVTIPVPTEGCIIQIQNNLNSNVPSWATHGSGFTLNLKWRTNGFGWGTTQVRRIIDQYFEQFTNQTICGGITQMGNSSTEVVWLRGGGQYYFKFSRNLSATAQSATYTVSSQSVSPTSTAQNTIWSSAGGSSIQYNDQTISTTNMYTPVLYDWNNSAYFVDPASTSNLVGLTVANTISGSINGTANGLNSSNYISRVGSSGNYNTDFQNTPAGTVRHLGDDASATNNPGGTWWFVDNYRHSNGSNYWGTQVAWGWEDQANKLATRNITGGTFGSWVYYLNSGNYSSYAIARGGDTVDGITLFRSNKGATSTVGSSNTYALQAFSSDAGAAGMSFHRGGYYAVNMGLDPDNVFRIGGWSASANRLQLDMSGNLTLAGVVDATQFRDSSNTAYYIDPASQSKLYNLLIETGTANTSMTIVGSNQPSIFLKTTDNARNIEIFNSYGNFGIYRSNAPSNYIIYHVDNGANSSTEMQLQGTARLTINSNGLTGATSVRSPIFYDSDNTGYYIDAASTSILNLVRTRNTFGERIAVTSAASTTIDTNFNVTELTMSASITTLTLSNIQASTIVHMWTIVTVGNGTAYSITWPAAIKWPGGTAPTITSTNAKRDIYQFVTYDGGTNIYAIIVGQNL